MSEAIHGRLVNADFGDAGVLVECASARHALLLDIGDIAPLTTREILRVERVCVSHLHIDHIFGFERLLRTTLLRAATIQLVGPPGLVAAIEHKLQGFQWNLLSPRSVDLGFEVFDWDEAGFHAAARFRARGRWLREALEPPRLPQGIVVETAGYRIEAAVLDHGTPVLAFALQEPARLHVSKPALAALGLQPGTWIAAAKEAIERQAPGDTPIAIDGRSEPLPLARLADGVIVSRPGRRIAYVTDTAHSPANIERILRLARGADTLFIEAGFADADRDEAADRKHLTAAQAGRLAREAGVAEAIPFHFSPRYLAEPQRLRNEFYAAFRGVGYSATAATG